jgi:hypothetical protein
MNWQVGRRPNHALVIPKDDCCNIYFPNRCGGDRKFVDGLPPCDADFVNAEVARVAAAFSWTNIFKYTYATNYAFQIFIMYEYIIHGRSV